MTAEPRTLVNPATGQLTTTTANRWDAACYAGHGCPCHHDPHSSLGSCDHGWTSAAGGRSAKCHTCRDHAQARAQQRKENRR